MAASKKEELLPRARALYAAGTDKEVIAEALGVSLRTVQRWAKQDADAGRPWRSGEPASADGTAPGRRARLRRRLQERLERLVQEAEIDPDSTRLEDRMLKICRVLDYLGDGDDLTNRLKAMERFASFCMKTYSDAEMDPIRRAIREFMDHLKEEHS